MSRRVVVRVVGPVGIFTMAVAAELAGLHPQTLRAYERAGLLSPARTEGGTRRYSDEDLVRARRIAELSGLGLSLPGIALVLELEASVARLEAENAELRDALAGAPGLEESPGRE